MGKRFVPWFSSPLNVILRVSTFYLNSNYYFYFKQKSAKNIKNYKQTTLFCNKFKIAQSIAIIGLVNDAKYCSFEMFLPHRSVV